MAVPDLKYMTQRVVEDASKKVRQDWQPVLENLASNTTTPMIATAIAAWAHLLADSPLCKDRGFPLIDSSIADLEPIARELVANESDMESAARRFVTHIFGHNEKINSALGKQIVTSLKEMQKIGIRACVAKMSN
jgi:mannitol-1-phosphate/altronate dehydrogenase